MTGLDTIISRIGQEATVQASSMIVVARKEAAGVIDKANADALQKKEALMKKADAANASLVERAKSTADLKKRTILLQTKQELIRGIIEKAQDKLNHLDDAAYFELLEKMIKAYAQPQDGILYLSEKDKKRMPADFAAKAADLAKANGGTITIADETKKIENGFVLVYGGIEENCTFKSLISSKKEELQDIVHKELFS